MLAADQDIEFALRGLLARPANLGIRGVEAELFRHPYHDPGCFGDSHNFLRTSLRTHTHALVVFDREGCGHDAIAREELERLVESRLDHNGWEGRSAAIAIDPELEMWAWSGQRELEEVIGWSGRATGLFTWLREANHLRPNQAKPSRPKEALRAALRHLGKPPSSSLFERLGRVAPLAPCEDQAFAKLLAVLRAWFAAPDSGGCG